MHERGISARKNVIEREEYDTYSVANFKEDMKKVNLNLILGKETPYYKKLFIEGYEPGTFTLHDRKNQPDFLSEDERDYTQWLKNVVKRELTDLKNTGKLETPFTDKLIEDITNQVFEILEYRLENGKQICELVYNQEYPDIIHRIIAMILTGDPEREFYIFRNFNKIGFKVAYAILSENPKMNSLDLLKQSIASGVIGIDIKGEDSAASPTSNLGIELTLKNSETIQDKINFVKDKLKEISMKEFAIDFWPEFKQEVLDSNEPFSLTWFTDDYIESLFDLKFIEHILIKNEKLTIHLVPKAGRLGTDAAYEDILEFLEKPLFKNLNELKNSGRFTISKNGPTQGTVNGKKMSKEVASLIENSNTIFVKGARSYEMLQGIKKTAYFAFVVCREFSEAVTGLDARNLPLVLIRQGSSECSFRNFKYRAKRRYTFPDGRTIYIAERTAIEYMRINKRHYYYGMVM